MHYEFETTEELPQKYVIAKAGDSYEDKRSKD